MADPTRKLSKDFVGRWCDLCRSGKTESLFLFLFFPKGCAGVQTGKQGCGKRLREGLKKQETTSHYHVSQMTYLLLFVRASSEALGAVAAHSSCSTFCYFLNNLIKTLWRWPDGPAEAPSSAPGFCGRVWHDQTWKCSYFITTRLKCTPFLHKPPVFLNTELHHCGREQIYISIFIGQVCFLRWENELSLSKIVEYNKRY